MKINGGAGEKGFHIFATKAAYWVGTKSAFLLALFVVLGWVLSGPYFHYSATWQLVINTGTTVVTFLVVFLIQNTQNRDAKAIHLKLDESLSPSMKQRMK
jgi:low affinity Fe/Cu permease